MKKTYEYGPRGRPLFPTPLLSKTRIVWFGERPKWFTCMAHEKDVLFNLSQAKQLVSIYILFMHVDRTYPMINTTFSGPEPCCSK